MAITKVRRRFVFRDAEFPFHVGRGLLSTRRFPMHTHDFAELVIIFGGQAVHRTGGCDYPICAGDIFLIQGDRSHGFTDARDLDIANIMYDPRLLDIPGEPLKKIPGYHALFVLEPRYRPAHDFQSRLRLGPKDLPHVSELVTRMEKECSASQCGYQAMTTSLLLQLVTFLSRRYSGIKTTAGQSLLRVASVISHIENHYQDPITLGSLAGLAHMSPNQLLRVFRQATDLSPIDYLIRFRVNKARKLLLETDWSITDIAFRVGFTDSNYFTRQFRKISNITPREFRAHAI